MDKNQHMEETKNDIIKRLNRIEGQVRGIKNMVEAEKGCVEILTQVAAVRSAVNKVGGIILEKYAKDCVLDVVNENDKERKLGDLIDTVQKFLNFVD